MYHVPGDRKTALVRALTGHDLDRLPEEKARGITIELGFAPLILADDLRVAIVDDMTSDRNFFDQGIVLNYSVDAGPVLGVPMEHSGGQIYRGEIPGQASLSVVEYDVTAHDWNDNTSTSPTLEFSIPSCAPRNNSVIIIQKTFSASLTHAHIVLGSFPVGIFASSNST